ncbi:sulfite oxidase heme-binding subunit YedZ [Beggiatoa leptomitoformis]|uniref:Protein-methionine-sulfoxide reductase heme-binding subunit MsrQ n=1 Tax=Beggiatoa leptomitoformis TaxID=288004 RepID=A0A2N9YE92_9GAMM|nr:protein-methionine-sulfoxide reductase heme-binding subunit MsrQ [Beggiatoa leptomitoformis]ALG68835.1 sulfoxide reductase heme-binding subunit YedZ [Beggiatoa leptomitoformis]AUI68800.1 sulfoxide reductase heme-binding subunit YedZ [Beggiatoa leptomitoformis]
MGYIPSVAITEKVIKPAVFILCLLPLGFILFTALHHVNPIEFFLDQTGLWTLRLLLITLCITPLRKITKWNGVLRLRRMLGLYSFFYSVLHATTYVIFDQSVDISSIIKDIAERPFIMVGFLAFILLIPLAITSTNAMIKRLGGKRWQALHRFVYLIGIAGVLHFWWLAQSKANLGEPFIYAVCMALLLLVRYPPIMARVAKS